MFKLTRSTKNEAPPSPKHHSPTRYNTGHDSGYLLRLQRPGPPVKATNIVCSFLELTTSKAWHPRY